MLAAGYHRTAKKQVTADHSDRSSADLDEGRVNQTVNACP
jgi:hypothetical protein